MIKELLLFMGEGGALAALSLLLLALFLMAVRHNLICHTVRIYNWDGASYRFLGRERLYRRNDTYVVDMSERMGDLSYTARYVLLVSTRFVKKNRYENLLLRAGRNEIWLPVEERMRAEVLFSYR